MKPTDKKTLSRLQKKNWQLWALTFLCLFVYALGIIIITDPNKWETIVKSPARHTITIILVSLMILTFLFCLYIILSERRINKLRNLIIEQQGFFLRDTILRLTALEKVYRLVTRSLFLDTPEHLDKLLDEIARIMKDVFKANYASIMLIDEPNYKIKTQGLFGLESVSIRRAILKIGESIAGYVVEKNKSLLLDRHTDYTQFNGYFKKDLNIQSAMSSPLLIDGKIAGVVNITNLTPSKDFTNIDLKFLDLVVKDIAFSVEYAQKLKDLTTREAKLVKEKSFIQIGKLAASLAHDFKNALFVAQGYLEMMKSNPQFSEARGTLSKIDAALGKLQQTIRNLLILGRQYSSSKKEIDINQLLKNVFEPMKEMLSTRKITTTMRLAPNLPVISADPEQLQVVLVNLIKNADEAIENTDRKELAIATEITKEGIQIKIQDTGYGIPPEITPKIFESFFTTKTAGKNSGLGLSIVENIIRAHNGKIEVASKLGQGTTFTITLPL